MGVYVSATNVSFRFNIKYTLKYNNGTTKEVVDDNDHTISCPYFIHDTGTIVYLFQTTPAEASSGLIPFVSNNIDCWVATGANTPNPNYIGAISCTLQGFYNMNTHLFESVGVYMQSFHTVTIPTVYYNISGVSIVGSTLPILNITSSYVSVNDQYGPHTNGTPQSIPLDLLDSPTPKPGFGRTLRIPPYDTL